MKFVLMRNFICAITVLARAAAITTPRNTDFSSLPSLSSLPSPPPQSPSPPTLFLSPPSPPPSHSPALASTRNAPSPPSTQRACSVNSSSETYDCPHGLGWSCPPALFCDDESGVCQCGLYPHKILLCIESVPFVLNCNCVTFDCVRNLTLAGSCLYTCGNAVNASSSHAFYTQLQDSYKRSSEVCSNMSRTGALCGRCKQGYYPLAYSYNMTCVRYSKEHWNWLFYIMAAYLPLTLFYFVILLLNINISSSYLYAIITHCQVISLPVMLRILLRDIAANSNESFVTGAKVLFSVYGIWNLDFFRPFYSDLCLGMGILPTLALDYAIAVYPLLLMVVSYMFIELHDSNCRIIRVMWIPFKRILLLFRRKWDIRTSVIDAYATFFLLSNTKFLSVSFDLLVPTKVYKLHKSEYLWFLGLYYAQDIEYFNKEHLPYALLAIFVLSIFVFLPVFILLCYPFRIFQKFLNLFPFRWSNILRTFVDPFQGCYKNGTEPGTRDYRWFSSVHFLVRIFLLAVYALTLNVVFFPIAAVTLIAFSLMIIILQPYRSAVGHNNLINAVFTLLLAMLFILAASTNLSALFMVHLVPFFRMLCFVITCVSFVYGVAVVMYWCFRSRRFGLRLLQRIRGRGYEELEDPVQEEEEERGGREGGGGGCRVGEEPLPHVNVGGAMSSLGDL